MGYTQGPRFVFGREIDSPRKFLAYVLLFLLVNRRCKGGTGKILEYFGPGVESQSCTGNPPYCLSCSLFTPSSLSQA